MSTQTWEDDILPAGPTVQWCIGHVVVHQAELTMDRLCVADHILTAQEAEKRARLGRQRLETTLARLLHDFAARWCDNWNRAEHDE